MTAVRKSTEERSLPSLSGRLLWLYRLVWCVLALGAVAAVGVATFQYPANPVIAGLRLTKSAVVVGVATILFRRRQRDPVAALLALAFLSWTISSSFDFASGSELAQVVDRCRFLLFAVALLLFPDGRWQPGWTRQVAWASAGVFLIGIGETLGTAPTNFFLPLAVPCVLAGIASLVARFRATADYCLKQQIKWVALGLVAGVSLILCARAGSAISTMRGPAMSILWEALFQLGIVIVALGFMVSLLRYRLFDAETVITRSAAYAALTIALVAAFGGTEAFIQNVGQDYLGMNIGGVSGGMAAAVAAVLLNPLHHRITDWAENRFQPDLVLLKREMEEIAVAFATEGSERELASAVLKTVTAGIHSAHSAMMIGGRMVAADGIPIDDARNGARMSAGQAVRDRGSANRLFPLRLLLANADPSAAVWLLIGPRPDGTLYRKEDLDAVRSTVPSLQRAFHAARARATIAAAIDRRENLLRREIQRLDARLQCIEART